MTISKLTLQDLTHLNKIFNFVPKRNIEVLAFIRFTQEDVTFKQCLESLLPTITKGVLLYHDFPADSKFDISESLRIAREFVAKNPGFKIFKYNHIVYRPCDEMYFKENNEDFSDVNRLDTFYNATLDCLKQLAETDDPYLLKVDADHIYDAKAIAEQIDFINYCPIELDQVFVPKVNVIYFPPQDKLYFTSIVFNRDHFIARANKINFTCMIDHDKKWAWEEVEPELYLENAVNEIIEKPKILELCNNYLSSWYDYQQQLVDNSTFPQYYPIKEKLFNSLATNREKLVEFFLSFKQDKDLVFADIPVPSYNSLHFFYQKYWTAEYGGHMMSFEELKEKAENSQWNLIDYQDWLNGNDSMHCLAHSPIALPTVDENDKSVYLIADYDRIMTIARSFYQD